MMRKSGRISRKTRGFLAAGIVVAVTFAVTALPFHAKGTGTWSEYVTVDAQGTHNSMAISLTESAIYLCSWEYDDWADGSVWVFGSLDGGGSWSKANVFGVDVKDAHPDMCAYTNDDGTDTILVASCGGFTSSPGMVAASTDHGITFSRLTDLPLGGPYEVNGVWHNGNHWRYMAVGTNASWRGTPADNDIYVFGSMTMDSWWSGILYLSMTVSHDNGVTWEDPWVICPMLSYYPEVTTDGTNLFMIFSSLETDVGYASIYAMKSSDWGRSWSVPKMVYQRTYLDGGCSPCSIQDRGDGSAVVTASDRRYIYIDNKGIWGILNYSDLTFDLRGYVSGLDWYVDLGFAGKVTSDGRLALGWNHRNHDAQGNDMRTDDNRFVYGTNVNLGPVEAIEANVDFKPESFNVKSKGGWVKAYIELPDGYDPEQVLVASILLNDLVPCSGLSNVQDFDEDGIPELVVRFDRMAVAETLGSNAEEVATITGLLYDGTPFHGSAVFVLKGT